MSTMFDPTRLAEAISEAPQAGFSQLNFGRVTMQVLIATWSGKKDEKREKSIRPYQNEKLGKGETLELDFTIKLSELKPELTFDYHRNVPVKHNNPKKGLETDYDEILEPSLIAVFGPNWAVELMKQPYVCIEDVPNIAGKANETTGKVYGVPKFIAKYASAAECALALEERLGDGSVSSTDEIPADVIAKVKALVASVGNLDAVKQMLGSHPYGNYDPDTLLAKAS